MNLNEKIITDFIFYEKYLDDNITINEINLIFVLWNKYIKTMDYVFEKWKENRNIKILISWGYYNNINNWNPEYLEMYKYWLELWIPQNNFILEKKASNTKENIIFSTDILNNYKNILIFCKAFHTKRVLMYLNKHIKSNNKNYIFNPIIDHNNISKSEWYKSDFWRNRVYDEFIRIGEYSKTWDL